MAKSEASDRPIQSVDFPNGNTARLVTTEPITQPAAAAAILQALEVKKPGAVLLISGGADTLDEAAAPRLEQLFSRGIARAALQAEAAIIDGGTHSGVMRLMGEGVADRGRGTVLLGVAPKGKVTYPGGSEASSIEDGAPLDSNHSHFVLVESDAWGSEVETMFALAEALAQKEEDATVPTFMLLVGGGEGARDEALRCVRYGWPLLVLEDSGGTADEIATAWPKRNGFIKDPILAEIIVDGDVRLFPITNSAKELEQRILHVVHQLSGETLLRRVWHRFATYDAAAERYQAGFARSQLWILLLGVLAVALALIQTQIFGTEQPAGASWEYDALRYAIIAVPILISILVAAANRFKAGNKWILLRAAAEAIKREIFRYRTRAGIYSETERAKASKQADADVTRDARLAERVKAITGQLMKTTVNEAALRPYEGQIPPEMYGAAGQDDGVSDLTPARYIAIRVQDQLSFFKNKTGTLERWHKRFQWSIFIVGGIGTLLAAIGLELWVALTTAVAGAFAIYVEYRQTEYTLTKYNQTATDLENILDWWMGLTPAEQAYAHNQSLLVEQAEKALENELSGWVQQMQDTLTELQEKQVKEYEGKVRTAEEEPPGEASASEAKPGES